MKHNQDLEDHRDKPAVPDDHGVAEGVGAGGGALTGALLGAQLGPLGAVTGAVLGGVFGTVAGRGIAQSIEPEGEEAHWKEHFTRDPNGAGYAYEDYRPAYRLGWCLFSPDTSFEAMEPMMIDEWARDRDTSKLEWHQARESAKEGWARTKQSNF